MKYKIVENTFRCLRMFIMVLRIGYTKCYANVLQNSLMGHRGCWKITGSPGRLSDTRTHHHEHPLTWKVGRVLLTCSHEITLGCSSQNCGLLTSRGTSALERKFFAQRFRNVWFQPVNVEFDACTSTKLQKAHQPKLIASAN